MDDDPTSDSLEVNEVSDVSADLPRSTMSLGSSELRLSQAGIAGRNTRQDS